jgi:hypothetical protein
MVYFNLPVPTEWVLTTQEQLQQIKDEKKKIKADHLRDLCVLNEIDELPTPPSLKLLTAPSWIINKTLPIALHRIARRKT